MLRQKAKDEGQKKNQPGNGIKDMNRRQRMRATNRLAVDYLLKNGYDNIWLKSHTKFKDIIYTKSGNYRATDLWNLFDGICTGFGTVFFIQIKTNAWPKSTPIENFVGQTNSQVLVLNAKQKSNGRYEIVERKYLCQMQS